jgi:beta-glucosidase
MDVKPILPRRAALAVCAALFAGPGLAQIAHPALWPQAASPAAITDAATEARISALMGRMSLEEKVGQTIQADISAITPEDLRAYPLGGLLAGGDSSPGGDKHATPATWVAFLERLRAVASENRPGHTAIPIIFGIDAVHGHQRIIGATIFPHNIGLGAARDPDLVRRIGAATAEEVAATGADWTFAPTVAVPQDIHWGRTYEGFASDPEVVKSYAGPITLGVQGELVAGRALAPGHIAGSAKHFLADGGTQGGKDQGDAVIPEADLIRLHAQGYPPAIDAGILTVMASFSSWNGVKHTANASLLTDVLKGRMGFEGFVVGDWNAQGEVPGCRNDDCPAAINAGLDMYMAPDSWKGLFSNTLGEVKSGQIPMRRLDDAVRRILRVKVKAGLFEATRPYEGRFDRLGSPDHLALAREAVRKSLVLLKNNGSLLPIRASAHVLVAGDGADDIGKQSGGWTISWQGLGNKNSDFPHGQSIWSGIQQAVEAGGGHAELAVDGRFQTRPDVAIVVFGENPYAEFQGDIATLEYQPGGKRDLALLKSMKAKGIPVVSVFLSGRPLWTNPEINASDAFVAAWLPGIAGGGVADVLVRKPDGGVNHDFTGRLSFPWPRRAEPTPDPQFPYGYGLTYAHGQRVADLSEDPGATPAGPNVDRYFAAGHAIAPWTMTTTGEVTLQPIDAGAQENARLARWTGAAEGALAFDGPASDLSRQTTGALSLTMRYRLDAAPSAPVMLAMRCGADCGGALDISSHLSPSLGGEWRTLAIRLSCFMAAGARMDHIVSPFRLSTNGTLTLAFSDIRLVSADGDPTCPH